MTYTARKNEKIDNITPVASELTYGCPIKGLADRIAGLSRDFRNIWLAPSENKWTLKQIEDSNQITDIIKEKSAVLRKHEAGFQQEFDKISK